MTKAYAAISRRSAAGSWSATPRRLAARRRRLDGRDRGGAGRGDARRSSLWGPGRWIVLAPLGYRMPMAVKRGYHMHYRARGNAALTRPVLDEETGFVITPMERGIRLTTGAEFAPRDAPRTPVQLDACEAVAPAALPARRARRSRALDGRAADLPRFAAGDRPGAAPPAASGSPSATSISASRSARRPGGSSPR